MSAVTPLTKLGPASAHVVLVNIEPEIADFLSVCLFQIGVEALILKAKDDLSRRKFEGCIVDLRLPDAEETLRAMRESARNRRAVLFGIYSESCDLRRFSKYGINGLIPWPAKRTDAIKVLRSAQTLLVHELRRYARIPLATQVEVTLRSQKLRAISRELSGGGMSLCFPNQPDISTGESAELSFEIPPGTPVSVRAVGCWSSDAGKLLGFQFISGPDKLKPIRTWIDDYLGIA